MYPSGFPCKRHLRQKQSVQRRIHCLTRHWQCLLRLPPLIAKQGIRAQNFCERISFSRKRHENNFLNENGHSKRERNQIYKVLNALISCRISNSHRNPITYQTGPRKNETEHLSNTYFSLKINKHPEIMDTYKQKQQNDLPSPCTMSDCTYSLKLYTSQYSTSAT